MFNSALSIIDRSTNFARSLTRNRDKDLHSQLTTLLNRIDVTGKSLDSKAEQKLIKKLLQARENGDEALAKNLEEQINAIKSIKNYSENDGIQELVRKVYDKEGLSAEGVDALLEAVKSLEPHLSVLNSSPEELADLNSAIAALNDSFNSDAISDDQKTQILREVATFTGGSSLLADEGFSKIISEGINNSNPTDESEALLNEAFKSFRKQLSNLTEIPKLIDSLNSSLDNGQEIDASSYLALQDLLRTNSKLASKANDISSILNNANIDEATRHAQLKSIFSQVSSQTNEVKMLHSLNELNRNFDSAILNNEQITESLQRNDLEGQLRERPESITSAGKGILSTGIGAAMAAAGLGNIDGALGISDSLGDMIGDKIADKIFGTGESNGRVGRRSRRVGLGQRIRSAPSNIYRGAVTGIRNTGSRIASVGTRSVGLARAGGSVLRSVAGAGKAIPLAGAAIGTGMAVMDYANAESDEERKSSVGSGVGAAIGAAVGSFIPIPVVGTALGAMAGGWLGGKAAELFSDPDDKIPDEIKKLGPLNQARFINQDLIPNLIASGDADEDDINELRTYVTDDLLSKNSLKKYFKEDLLPTLKSSKPGVPDNKLLKDWASFQDPATVGVPNISDILTKSIDEFYPTETPDKASVTPVKSSVDKVKSVDVEYPVSTPPKSPKELTTSNESSTNSVNTPEEKIVEVPSSTPKTSPQQVTNSAPATSVPVEYAEKDSSSTVLSKHYQANTPKPSNPPAVTQINSGGNGSKEPPGSIPESKVDDLSLSVLNSSILFN